MIMGVILETDKNDVQENTKKNNCTMRILLLGGTGAMGVHLAILLS